jgi:hypothetical protein
MTSRSYAWGWWWLVGAIVCGLLYLIFFIPPVKQYSLRPTAENRLGGEHYFILHMPSIASKKNYSVDRADTWFAALGKAGFQPMRLTDIHQRLQAGKALPKKAIALVFDPGYRTTYEVMQPLLEKYRFPAVWISDKTGMEEADRRFISFHLFRGMEKSGVWDVGWYEKDSTLHLKSQDKDIVLGKDSGTWRVNAGRRALNDGIPKGDLNRLYSNWNWTAQQLVNRLGAEQPLDGPNQLVYEKIQDHKWGVIVPLNADVSPFDLKAPMEERTAGLSWLGTRGVDNAAVDVEVEFFSGEFWVLLRSNEEKSEHIGVCFSNGRLLVSQMIQEKTYELYNQAVPSLARGVPFFARVVLRGDDLRVWVNGFESAHVTKLVPPSTGEGILRLKIYDKILGAAYARGIKLQMAPL